MTDETGSPAGSEAMELPADAPETFESVRDAAAYFTSLQDKRKEPAAESAPEATAENELAKANDGPDEDPTPAEEPEGDDPDAEKLLPIERPRSWSKDDDDDWNALPRARQEKIAANERAREADIRQRINDAAEKLKGLTAKEQEVEKVKQQYESGLRSTLQALEREQLRDFADIKTWDDVKNLQRTDPFRYQEWDVHQKELALVSAQTKDAETRQQQEHQSQWMTHVQKENELAAEFIPELADKIKGQALTQRVATELLPELGFKDSELADLASGKSKLSIYDHRVQRLLADAVKLRDIQSAKTAVAAKPLPPVQKPGTSKPQGAGVSERIQALEAKFNKTGDLKDASALYAAQLEAKNRRRAS